MRKTLGADLSAFEIMWPEFYAFASQVRPIKPLPVKDNFYLLVEQECTTEIHHVFGTALGQCHEDGLLIEAVIGHSKQNSPNFWL